MSTSNSRFKLFYTRRGQTKMRSTVHWGIESPEIRARLRKEQRHKQKNKRKKEHKKTVAEAREDKARMKRINVLHANMLEGIVEDGGE